MTHSTNYAKDRLALELFESLFQFIKQWTKLQLKTNSSVNLAKAYFQMFPEDRTPLWTVREIRCNVLSCYLTKL